MEELRAPHFLGWLSDGKEALLERLQHTLLPAFADIDPQEVHFLEDARDQLPPTGFSVRYAEVTRRRLQNPVLPG